MSIRTLSMFAAAALAAASPAPAQQPPQAPPQTVAAEAAQDAAWPFVVRGYVGVEGRIFMQSPAFPDQIRNGAALVGLPEISYTSDDRRHRVNAVLFGRLSLEPAYGSADVRELFWQYRKDRWSLVAGMNRVFWGATESRHAIDIVNQSDMRENYIGDIKLGQFMVAASWQRSWGQLEFYVLPFFRPRAFPVIEDRPRLQLPIEEAEVSDGSPVDFAGRVSISRGDVDLHAYYFRGVNREPDLAPIFDASGAPTALKPFYNRIDQIAGDVQFARGAWLFKGELMHRHKGDIQYQAGVGGVEYGIARLFGSASDLALLAEYQFDNRPETEWPAPATHGIFAGMRIAINDKGSSEAKGGTVFDVPSHSWLVRGEFTRRLADQWGLYVSYSGFANTGNSPALRDYGRDSYFTIMLRRYL